MNGQDGQDILGRGGTRPSQAPPLQTGKGRGEGERVNNLKLLAAIF